VRPVLLLALIPAIPPPYITFSACVKQNSVGEVEMTGKLNTYANIEQAPLFIVNIPGKDLLSKIDTIAYPYNREDYIDKIAKAGLTKIEPFELNKANTHYPPLIKECLAHFECEVIDIHRPKASDHYNITGKVVGVSYDAKLGKELDEIRINLVHQSFHHFGSNTKNFSERYMAFETVEKMKTDIIYKLEKKK
jgi:flavin reductase (DIM6/NTAB) family NADH-FMN oxidoreductase RutF